MRIKSIMKIVGGGADHPTQPPHVHPHRERGHRYGNRAH